MRLLKFGLVLSAICVALGAAILFLKPKDELQSLKPFVVKEESHFTQSPLGLQRVRLIYLAGLTTVDAKQLLLKTFPKSEGWLWSGYQDTFFDANKGFYTVSATPTPIASSWDAHIPGNSTVMVTEYLPLDKKTEFWERLMRIGKLPIEQQN